MKPHALFSTPLIVATAVLSTACGDVIEVDVLRPAEVEVGTHIQRVMVIDRAAPKNFGEELLAGVEGLTTAEGLLADKEARGVIIDEVIAILEESPRFDVVYAYPSKYEINSTIWDTSLDRWEVMNLCDQYGCDGIISLEAIDSDSDIFDLTEVITSEEEDRVVETVHYIARRETTVLTSFRFYDARSGMAVDEVREHRLGDVFDAEGDTWEATVAGLPDGRSVVRGLANDAGEYYAKRVAPLWETVNRPIYNRGDAVLEAGVDRLVADDIDGAIWAWSDCATSEDTTIAGRCEYNLAVAMEAKGDLDSAYEHAVVANQTLGNYRTQNYVAELRSLMR